MNPARLAAGIITQREIPPGVVTSKNVYVGLRVMRGADWTYYQQVSVCCACGKDQPKKKVLHEIARHVFMRFLHGSLDVILPKLVILFNAAKHFADFGYCETISARPSNHGMVNGGNQ